MLLIAFKYPPYPEVGARRWAKLTKYLARSGVEIDVLTVRWPPSDASLIADTTSGGITVHRLPSLGPHLFARRSFPGTTVGRIVRRARDKVWRGVRSFGWAQEARFWGLAMLPGAIALTRRKGIQTVVVTGTPFFANYWATRLKDRLPGVRLVQEFRDPWSDLPQVKSAPAKERSLVERRESTVLRSADAIVTVADGLAAILERRAGGKPVLVVRNGYDPEDFRSITQPNTEPVLLYAGNAAAGRQVPLESLLLAIRSLGPGFKPFRLRFFGAYPEHLPERYADLVAEGLLELHERVSAARIADEISRSFVCLQLSAEAFPYALSTKVYEYAFAGRPVLCLNYGGDIDEFVKQHQLGWSIHADDVEGLRNALLNIVSLYQREPQYRVTPADLERYSVANLAEQYRRILFPGSPQVQASRSWLYSSHFVRQ